MTVALRNVQLCFLSLQGNLVFNQAMIGSAQLVPIWYLLSVSGKYIVSLFLLGYQGVSVYSHLRLPERMLAKVWYTLASD